jgi:hypothetical protein
VGGDKGWHPATVGVVTGDIDPRNLLVSDAEREHVGQLLQRAVGQGRITIDEFDTRMAAAMAARTRGDLNVLVMDLALPVNTAATLPAKQELTLRGGVGDIKRRGRWVVPPLIRVTGGMGDVLLDFTEAQITAPVVTIDASVGMGSLKVVVPAGASVDVDDVHTSIGDVNDKVSRHRPQPGGTHFVVRGLVRLGDITVMHPRKWRLGPLTLHSPFRLTWGTGRDE